MSRLERRCQRFYLSDLASVPRQFPSVSRSQPGATQGIHALTTARRQQPRKTTAFIEFLRARFGAPPYWEIGAGPNVMYRTDPAAVGG